MTNTNHTTTGIVDPVNDISNIGSVELLQPQLPAAVMLVHSSTWPSASSVADHSDKTVGGATQLQPILVPKLPPQSQQQQQQQALDEISAIMSIATGQTVPKPVATNGGATAAGVPTTAGGFGLAAVPPMTFMEQQSNDLSNQIHSSSIQVQQAQQQQPQQQSLPNNVVQKKKGRFTLIQTTPVLPLVPQQQQLSQGSATGTSMAMTQNYDYSTSNTAAAMEGSTIPPTVIASHIPVATGIAANMASSVVASTTAPASVPSTRIPSSNLSTIQSGADPMMDRPYLSGATTTTAATIQTTNSSDGHLVANGINNINTSGSTTNSRPPMVQKKGRFLLTNVNVTAPTTTSTSTTTTPVIQNGNNIAQHPLQSPVIIPASVTPINNSAQSSGSSMSSSTPATATSVTSTTVPFSSGSLIPPPSIVAPTSMTMPLAVPVVSAISGATAITTTLSHPSPAMIHPIPTVPTITAEGVSVPPTTTIASSLQANTTAASSSSSSHSAAAVSRAISVPPTLTTSVVQVSTPSLPTIHSPIQVSTPATITTSESLGLGPVIMSNPSVVSSHIDEATLPSALVTAAANIDSNSSVQTINSVAILTSSNSNGSLVTTTTSPSGTPISNSLNRYPTTVTSSAPSASMLTILPPAQLSGTTPHTNNSNALTHHHSANNTSNNAATQGGLGKVLYFLDQMRIEVGTADRTIKALQGDLRFLKERNKELEAKVRETERKLAEERTLRESAESKAKAYRRQLRVVRDSVVPVTEPEPYKDEDTMAVSSLDGAGFNRTRYDSTDDEAGSDLRTPRDTAPLMDDGKSQSTSNSGRAKVPVSSKTAKPGTEPPSEASASPKPTESGFSGNRAGYIADTPSERDPSVNQAPTHYRSTSEVDPNNNSWLETYLPFRPSGNDFEPITGGLRGPGLQQNGNIVVHPPTAVMSMSVSLSSSVTTTNMMNHATSQYGGMVEQSQSYQTGWNQPKPWITQVPQIMNSELLSASNAMGPAPLMQQQPPPAAHHLPTQNYEASIAGQFPVVQHQPIQQNKSHFDPLA